MCYTAKLFGVLVLMFAVVQVGATQDQIEADSVTNADVIRMIEAGLSAGLVLATFESCDCDFQTSPSDLITLVQAGVPDNVARAMVAVGNETESATPPPAGFAPDQIDPVVFRPIVDPISFEYRLLATTLTSTMEKELNEASESGFRMKTVMGGKTAFGSGGDEAGELVIIMSRRPGEDNPGRYQYKLLATQRTSTMQREIQEAGDDGYVYVGQTVFHSAFGGDEVAVILERDRDDPDSGRYEYLLLATSRTSTMQNELQEAGDEGFTLVGMTVGKTAFGGDEVVAFLMRRQEEP